MGFFVFFFKQKTAYEMRISDWISDVCSSDLQPSMFYFPGLAQRPFFERSDFAWAGAVEAAADAIRAELLAMVGGAADAFGPYVTAAPGDRKSTRLNSSHSCAYRMPSSA